MRGKCKLSGDTVSIVRRRKAAVCTVQLAEESALHIDYDGRPHSGPPQMIPRFLVCVTEKMLILFT